MLSQVYSGQHFGVLYAIAEEVLFCSKSFFARVCGASVYLIDVRVQTSYIFSICWWLVLLEGFKPGFCLTVAN
jgi:hypothetical protein